MLTEPTADQLEVWLMQHGLLTVEESDAENALDIRAK
jgi:hypothetical protein